MFENLDQPGAATVIPLNKIGEYSGSSTGTSGELEKLLGRRHPEYVKREANWRFFSATYEGGPQWFIENIHRYFREGPDEFRERIERAYRFNHTKEVVDLLNKYLFKQNIVRSPDAPASIQKFWKHATKGGAGINEFAKQISKHCSIFGRVGIVVDRQRISGTSSPVTVEDEKKVGAKTYAYIVSPVDMLDYSLDDEGELNWILIQETFRNDADPFDTKNGEVKVRYRLWTRREMMLIEEVETQKKKKEKTYEITDYVAHNLGQVPIVFADNLLSDEAYGAPSLINDIAYLDRAVANYLSNLDAIIQDQTFSQLVMPAQNLTAGSEEEKAVQEMGTKRVFLYDAAGSTHSPEYISPDPQQAHLILDAIGRIIREIYNTVGLSSERTNKDNATSMDNASGVAKAYDFERVNALLSAKADSLEVVENKIARLVALWNGEEVPDKDEDPKEDCRLVKYPDNFDTRGLYDEFDIAARLMLVEAPDGIRQQQMRMVVEKLFPMIDKKTRDKIYKEIDEWPQSMRDLELDAVTMRTAQNDLADPKSNIYKTKTGGKGDATEKANGSAVDEKKPEATKRQGQVTKNTK